MRIRLLRFLTGRTDDLSGGMPEYAFAARRPSPAREADVYLSLPEPIRQRLQLDVNGWRTASCLSAAEAESLLDWLENHNIGRRELRPMEDGLYIVRWAND